MNKKEKYQRYSMVIQWSDEDNAYIVTLPEFPICRTHGKTLEQAIKRGQQVIESVIDICEEDKSPFPAPRSIGADLAA